MTDSEKIMSRAIATYGAQAQIDKAIEEMSELIKIMRDAVAEEIADVMIMLKQLRMIYDCDGKILDYQDDKLRRLEKRLNEAAKA